MMKWRVQEREKGDESLVSDMLESKEGGEERTWIGVPVRMTLLLQLIELSAVYVWLAASETGVVSVENGSGERKTHSSS